MLKKITQRNTAKRNSIKRNTITRLQLTGTISHQLGMSKEEAKGIVDSILALMGDAIVADKRLKLSNFGSFSVKGKRARAGRDFKTGQTCLVTVRNVVSFKPAISLKNKM